MSTFHNTGHSHPMRWPALASLMASLALVGCAPGASSEPQRVVGQPIELGSGIVHAYADLNPDGSPLAVGIAMTRAGLETLPTEKGQNPARCFDANGDGRIAGEHECLGDHPFEITLSDVLAASPETHFKWIGLDWNPLGHIPPGIYDLPHFDIHFYTASRDEVRRIRPGICGEMVDCEDFERGIKPLAAKYVPPDYKDLQVVAPDMGNHLLDMTSPELGDPPARFTHTFIYGVYDGKVTFLEPMVTTEFLRGTSEECAPIKQPAAWQVAGYYPTRYCMRHLADEDAYAVSLEGFVHHEAS